MKELLPEISIFFSIFLKILYPFSNKFHPENQNYFAVCPLYNFDSYKIMLFGKELRLTLKGGPTDLGTKILQK